MIKMLNLSYSGMKPDVKNDEKALAAKQGNKPYKKKCRICGQQGHKPEDCWEKNENKEKHPPNRKSRKGTNQSQQDGTSSTSRFNGKCHYCQKDGHRIADCRKKKREEANKASENKEEKKENDSEHVLIANFKPDTYSNTWVGDTGATSHMTNNDEGMFNCRASDSKVYIGDGKGLDIKKQGDLHVSTRVDGKWTEFTMKNVLYVPELNTSLFSITQAIQNGYKLNSENDGKHTKLVLSKSKFKLEFVKEENKNLLSFSRDLVNKE